MARAAQVVGMIAAYVSDEKFRDGVRPRCRRHTYGNASTDQFFDSLADAAHDPRDTQVAARLRRPAGACAVVTFRRANECSPTSRASVSPISAPTPPAEQWIIPLCIRQGDAKSCTLLDKPSAPIVANGTGTIVPNAGRPGLLPLRPRSRRLGSLIAAAPTLPTGEALSVDDGLWASFYAGR